MGSKNIMEFIKEIELGLVVLLIEVGQDEFHLLNLQMKDIGLANDNVTTLPHLHHLLDIHQGVAFTLVEDLQGVFPDILSNAIGNLLFSRLANEAPAHQTES